MDYKFWATLTVNIFGLGFMYWQVRIMKKQIGTLPPSRSAKRLTMERRLSTRLYTPVFVMAGLVLISWLPYVIISRASNVMPQFLVGWTGATQGCSAVMDTSPFLPVKEKDRLFLVCQIADPTVDPLEDERIAISKPFNITGGPVQMAIEYTSSSRIAGMAKLGTTTGIIAVLLPKDKDGSTIRRLSDVPREGGQIVVPGVKLKD